MKKLLLCTALALCVALSLCTGCAAPAASGADGSDPVSAALSDASSAEHRAAGEVAAASELAPAQELDLEGLTPVGVSELEEGSYAVQVDSSSSMFRITACTLSVSGEGMTAELTMGGTGYLWLYPGTGAEAAASEEADRIAFEEDAEGVHHFRFPVKALDEGLPCAAYSKRKEKWYERTLVFRSDSLPAQAWRNAPTGSAPELADGTYSVEVRLSGGSGRASVESPAELTAADGQYTARIIWSSPHYDYMLTADGTRLEPVNTEGNSAFDVPVPVFDAPVKVQADTTAMSTPHLIDYTLTFSLLP